MDDRLRKRKARGLRRALKETDADFEQRLRKRDEDVRKRAAAGSKGWTSPRRAKLAEKKAAVREATERKAAAREAAETEVAEQNAEEGFPQAQPSAAESGSNHNAEDVGAGAEQLAFNHRPHSDDGIEPHISPSQPNTDAERVENIEGGHSPGFIAQDDSNDRQDFVDERQEKISTRALVSGNHGEARPIDGGDAPVRQDQSEGDSDSHKRLPEDITPLVMGIRAHRSALTKIDTKLNRANASYRKAEAKMRTLLDDIFSTEAEFEEILEDLENEDMNQNERANVYDPFFDARDRVVELRQRLEARREQLRTDRGTLESALVGKVANLTPLGDHESSVAGLSESSELEAPGLQQEVDFSMQRTNLAAVERWVPPEDGASPPLEDPTPPNDLLSDLSSVQIGDEVDNDRNQRASTRGKSGTEEPRHAGDAEQEGSGEEPMERGGAAASNTSNEKAIEQLQRHSGPSRSEESSTSTHSPDRKRKRDEAQSEGNEEH